MATEISETALKLDLHNILDRVSKGEELLVKRGEGSVIRLLNTESQAASLCPQSDFDTALAEMHAFREAHPLNGLTVRELIDEGRKY